MKINLLDCTLREAPINGLVLGKNYIKKFIKALESANVDIIECGFLKNLPHNPDSTIFQYVEEIEPYLQNKKAGTLYVALVDYGRYDLKYLSDYDGKSIDGIRICFKKDERFKVFEYAKAIKDKGYKVFFQNVDTMSYSDIELLEVIEKVNELKPYAYSIVDTFGAMYAEDLRHIYSIVNHNLDKDIILGFHAHNNLMLANANTQEFVNLACNEREINIDSSILGCGRGAGNPHTECLAEFLNKKFGQNKDLDALLDIIDYLMPKFIQECEWGYSIPYFLSGIHSSHVFNVNHLLRRHNIKSKDLRAIIEKLDNKQKKAYDYKLLERLYVEHFDREIDDKKSLEDLSVKLRDREILLLVPGKTLSSQKDKVEYFIQSKNPIVIFVNNYISKFRSDYIFFSGVHRYQDFINGEDVNSSEAKILLTSNIKSEANLNEMIFNYLPLVKFGWINVDSSAILLLRLLIKLGIKRVFFAGFDGFSGESDSNYYDNSLVTTTNKEDLLLLTKETKEMLADLKNSIDIHFVTDSLYSEVFEKEEVSV